MEAQSLQHTEDGDTVLETNLGIDLNDSKAVSEMTKPKDAVVMDDAGKKTIPSEVTAPVTEAKPKEPEKAPEVKAEAKPQEPEKEPVVDDLSVLDDKYKISDEDKLTRSEKAVLKHTWKQAIDDEGEINPSKIIELVSNENTKRYAEKFARSQGYKNADELLLEVEKALDIEDGDTEVVQNIQELRQQEEKEYSDWKATALKDKSGVNELQFIKTRNELIKTENLTLKQAGEMALLKLENQMLRENAADPEKALNNRVLGGVPRSDTITTPVDTNPLLTRDQYFGLADDKRVEYLKTNKMKFR